MNGVELGELVERFGGELIGEASFVVRQVASLERAGGDQLSFLANPKYRRQLASTGAGAVILGPSMRDAYAGNRIVADDPYAYFALAAQVLNPPSPWPPGLHPSAVVECSLADTVSVGAGCYVAPGAAIGRGTRIGAGCSIGRNVCIGENSLLHPNVTVYDGCVIGRRALIHAGAVIGADGFGFARRADHSWLKIPQIGRVVIGDDVEIGAGTTIDRGALDDTVIEDGVKLDNQIQVGHNVRIGAHTAMAACVGIAGSARIGCRCMIGGAAMILGHISIADDVQIAGATYVGKSITRAGSYVGSVPLQSHDVWLKNFAHLRHLDAMADRIRALERRLLELENKS